MRASLFFLALLLAVSVASEVETEDNVYIGTDANLDSLIANTDHLLVEFYAPWCGHCKSLAPEYAKAAKQLAGDNSAVKLVKVDATIHSKVAEVYQVQGYPTLKWFSKGSASDYNGGRTASEIVAWVTKKSGPPAVAVTTEAEVKALADKNEVVIVGAFTSTDSDEAKVFLTAAADTDVTFAITTSAALAKALEIHVPGVASVKSGNEKGAAFGSPITDPENIKNFAQAQSIPLVVEFNEQNAPKIFGGSIKSHLLLFSADKGTELEEDMQAMKEAAEEHRGKVIFIYMDASKEEHTRVLDFFGITAKDLPTLRLVNLADEMAKYKPDFSDITGANIKAFVQSYVDGKLKRHVMTQELPEDWDKNPVKVLTGTNFAEVVQKGDKHALVAFVAPWCGHCKAMMPIWDQLAAKVEGATKDVVVAKIDSTANEIEGIKIESFPTIKYFVKGTGEMQDYEGGRTLKDFAAFITEQTGVALDVSDVKEPAEDGEDYGQEPEYDEEATGDGHDEL